MDSLARLRKVPAVSKQELFAYMASHEHQPPVTITTNSGARYYGSVVSVGKSRDGGTVLLLQLLTDRDYPTESFIQIESTHIESVLINGMSKAMEVFSGGAIASNPAYSPSGKLDVQRAFEKFTDDLQASTGLSVGAPEMNLPTDGLSLNRIIRLTSVIGQTLADILKQEDAHTSWVEKYKNISFVEGSVLEVSNRSPRLVIKFPFADIDAAEISAEALTKQVLGQL